MVSARTTTVKNGIATHYCSFGRVVHLLTNTINLRILPYKCIVMQKYSTSFTDIPYMVGTVNHATKMKVRPYYQCQELLLMRENVDNLRLFTLLYD